MIRPHEIWRLVVGETRAHRMRARFPTWLFPVRPGNNANGRSYVECLRDVVQDAEVLNGVFQRCPMVHMIRCQVIDDARPDPGTRTDRVLPYPFLLITAELDGHFQDLSDQLFLGHAVFVRRLFHPCFDFDDGWLEPALQNAGRVAFRRFMAHYTIGTHLPFIAIESSVARIRAALARQEDFTRLFIDSQGLPAEQQLDAWRDFERRHPDLRLVDAEEQRRALQ